VDGQCGQLVTVIGHQFITLTVNICVQHGVREALHCAGLSAAAETCCMYVLNKVSVTKFSFDLSANFYFLGAFAMQQCKPFATNSLHFVLVIWLLQV